MSKNKSLSALLIGSVLFLTLTACDFSFNIGDSSDKSTDDKENVADEENTDTEDKDAGDVSFMANVEKLMKDGKPQECIWKVENPDIEGEMVDIELYVDGERFRMDMMSKIEDESGNLEEANMYNIYDGEYIYSWGADMGEYGNKMKYSDYEEMVESGEVDDNMMDLDFDKNFENMCKKWKVDKSKFELPDDVNFIDFYSDLLKGLETIDDDNDEDLSDTDTDTDTDTDVDANDTNTDDSSTDSDSLDGLLDDIDLSELEKTMEEAMDNLCAECDKLTGDLKDNCKKEMGCE